MKMKKFKLTSDLLVMLTETKFGRKLSEYGEFLRHFPVQMFFNPSLKNKSTRDKTALSSFKKQTIAFPSTNGGGKRSSVRE